MFLSKTVKAQGRDISFAFNAVSSRGLVTSWIRV
jgi:hypothetical protein